MKIVRFTSSGYPNGTYGIVKEDRLQIINGSPIDTIEQTGDEVSITDIQSYLPPVDPPDVLAIGLNYHNHAAEFESVPPTEPLLFIKATSAITAHQKPILIPAIAPTSVDYEAELVAIIGKTARNVSEVNALDYVLGYTCGNDVTARDCQARDGQWARAKSFDTFAPIGPWIETELDPSSVTVRMKLNGEIMQDQNTNDLIFGLPQLISHLSRCMTLKPGTVIFSGTPGGVGFTRKPPVFLKPGDICEVEIEGIGTLKNTVAESVD